MHVEGSCAGDSGTAWEGPGVVPKEAKSNGFVVLAVRCSEFGLPRGFIFIVCSAFQPGFSFSCFSIEFQHYDALSAFPSFLWQRGLVPPALPLAVIPHTVWEMLRRPDVTHAWDWALLG